ncbi:MAG: flagellin [Candidatus Lokiarchaeota archaeon]|nr:flagellin [Candidatus Lokiarchaeota archaeon]
MSRPSSPSESNDTGSVGIGSLIVFIAIVLVAGIAASVLIQTSTHLEMQALRTGSETITEVASGVKVGGVCGHNRSGTIDKIGIEITTKAGSPDIDLGETILEISDSSTKNVLSYNRNFTNHTSIDGNLFNNGDFGTSSYFGIIVLHDSDESCSQSNPVINTGDHVIIAIDTLGLFNGLAPRSDVCGLVICEEGSAGIVGFTVPASLFESVIGLQ